MTPEQQLDELMTLWEIPSHMHHAVKRYYLNGLHPGDFLWGALANDFITAGGHADSINERCLKSWAGFVANLPRTCTGSYERVNAWIAAGGAEGIARSKESSNV